MLSEHGLSSSQQPDRRGMVPIAETRKWRVRNVEGLAQSATATDQGT